jgi:hypothetical protein
MNVYVFAGLVLVTPSAVALLTRALTRTRARTRAHAHAHTHA